MKRLLSFFLALALVCCLLPTVAFAAESSGTCGENLTWTLVDGTLTISGTGHMENYIDDYFDPYRAPWYNNRAYITSVVIEEGVKDIGGAAFCDCTHLKSVTIPESVQGIGNKAFSECSNLQEISIPDSVTLIGEYAFYSCASLTALVIPENVIAIGRSAFRDCYRLKTVTIPDSITIFGDSVFTGCSKLENVTIPGGISEIGNYTFMYCSKLESITIPKNITKLGTGAFAMCSNLESIYFEGDAPEFTDGASGNHFSGVTATAWYPQNNATWTEEVMQNYGGNLTWVPNDSGSNKPQGNTCGENLTWTLEDGILTISGKGPMYDYSFDWLTLDNVAPWFKEEYHSIVISDGVTHIGSNAFRMSGAENIAIPDSVTSIGEAAFLYCDITKLTIPGSLKEISRQAFAFCFRLETVVIEDGVQVIGPDAFSTCSRLSGVTIPESVTTIGDYAFEQCVSLHEITIPAGVTSIGECAFFYSGIESIRFCGALPETYGFNFGYGFSDVTCYYPANEPSWEAVVSDPEIEGIIWIPYDSEDTEAAPGDLNGDDTVDDADVAQLLWHTLFPEDYPISGNADFNGDGKVDDADVAYLLWHTLFPMDYPLN